jgi:hypothetical protein
MYVLLRQNILLHKGRPRERETSNTYIIHQHLEAKHTAESLIKITGSIPRNTERTLANANQGKLRKTQKEARKPYFILILIMIY